MDIAGGLLPALGFALLARMIMKKELVPFFFIGYFIVAYSGISTTGVALFAILFMTLYFMMNKEKLIGGQMAESAVGVQASDAGGDFDEF